MMHRPEGDALAALAGQGIVNQHIQRLTRGNPGHREGEEHPPHRVQVPPGAGEEPVKGRDVPDPHRTGGQGDRGDRPTSQAVDPPGYQELKIGRAGRTEAGVKRRQQDDKVSGNMIVCMAPFSWRLPIPRFTREPCAL